MGEFNVNKSDGSLEQTAGMPDTYPAEQVMMSDGVTSVEDALDDVKSGLTGLVKTHTETGLTTNQYGICNLTLPRTNYIVDAVCSNYIVIPYRSEAGNHWDLVITDLSQDGAIVVQGNKTVNVTVHYI